MFATRTQLKLISETKRAPKCFIRLKKSNLAWLNITIVNFTILQIVFIQSDVQHEREIRLEGITFGSRQQHASS